MIAQLTNQILWTAISLSVCVIIPVFDVRPYLVEALDGVPQQTYNPIENIIIDDEFNDGLGKIE